MISVDHAMQVTHAPVQGGNQAGHRWSVRSEPKSFSNGLMTGTLRNRFDFDGFLSCYGRSDGTMWNHSNLVRVPLSDLVLFAWFSCWSCMGRFTVSKFLSTGFSAVREHPSVLQLTSPVKTCVNKKSKSMNRIVCTTEHGSVALNPWGAHIIEH